MAQLASQVGFNAGGDIGRKFGWQEGSPEKIVLHSVVAAAMASLGGGDVGDAVRGAVANQLAINAMADAIHASGYKRGTPEFESILKVGSTALDLAVGGGDGSSAALSATSFNYLLHSQREMRDAEIAACGDNAACREDRTTHWDAVSAQQSLAMTAGYGAAMDSGIYQQLLDTNPNSPAYDHLLAAGILSARGDLLSSTSRNLGALCAYTVVMEMDGRPVVSPLLRGMNAGDRARLESALLGPIFGGPDAAIAVFGGSPQQISAANQFGNDLFLMATAGSWQIGKGVYSGPGPRSPYEPLSSPGAPNTQIGVRFGLTGINGVKGTANTALALGETQTINDVSMTRFGRWMSPDELAQMQSSNRIVQGGDGQTFISTNGSADFKGAAPKGSVYVEFDVPSSGLLQGGKEGWYKMIGPDASKSQQYLLNKQGGEHLPGVKNIMVLDSK